MGAHPPPKPPLFGATDILDQVFDLVRECGGIEQLRLIVNRIAEQ